MDRTRQIVRQIVTGLTEQDESDPFAFNKAEFGTTEILTDAFYLLPDGTFLDGAGVNEGGSPGGGRAYDHRNIRYKRGGTRGMQEFQALGAIRVMPENGALDFVVEPTLEQYTRILQWVKYFNGEVIVEMERGLGELDVPNEYYRRNPDRAYKEFDEGDSPRKILGFIKRFWMKGQMTEDLSYRWGWVMPDGNLLEGDKMSGLAREFHGELVYRYWLEHGMVPEAADEAELHRLWNQAYLWAYHQGWLRYVGSNISAPVKSSSKTWDTMVRKHALPNKPTHPMDKTWYVDPVELEYKEGQELPTAAVSSGGFQIPWEDLIDTKSLHDAAKKVARSAFGRMGLQFEVLTEDIQDFHGRMDQEIAPGLTLKTEWIVGTSMVWNLYDAEGKKVGDGRMAYSIERDRFMVRHAQLNPSYRGKGLYAKVICAVVDHYQIPAESDSELTDAAIRAWEKMGAVFEPGDRLDDGVHVMYPRQCVEESSGPRPVLYLDLDNTLIYQAQPHVIHSRPLEEPVAEIGNFTVWKRPGADEALQRALSEFDEVHVLTTGQAGHQRAVVDAVFPGFPGEVYSTQDYHPPEGREWVLVDDMPGAAEFKAQLLGPELGTHVQVKPYVPVFFNRLREKMGKPQGTPEDGSVIVAAIAQALPA
jgi:hypothetical protein